MLNITQAFIFAAGRGERMRPITDSIPKPLVKIRNKSIIDYVIEKIDKVSSIKKIFINGFHLAEKIEEHIKQLNNPKIIFLHEKEKIETGGALVFAKDKIDMRQPLMTFNGDILWQEEDKVSDIKILCEAWDQNCDILLGLKKSNEYFGYENKKNPLSKNGFTKGDFNLVGEKIYRLRDMDMSHAFVGLQIINPRILQNPPEKCFSMSYFYNNAKTAPNSSLIGMKGVELSGKYFHISNVEGIKLTEEELQSSNF